MKVYVVVSGCYSDMTIEKVFLEEEKANFFVKTHQYWDDIRIEEFDTYDDNILVQPTYEVFYFDISLDSKGQVINTPQKAIFTEIPSENVFIEEGVISIVDRTKEMLIRVKADNEDSAIKTARDIRAKWFAETYGL